MKLKPLHNSTYIVETNKGTKLGMLIIYDNVPKKSGVEYLHIEGEKQLFTSFEEFVNAQNETVDVIQPPVVDATIKEKDLNGYPVGETEKLIDVEFNEELQISSFRKSNRSSKRFYAGWWIIISSTGITSPRLTISTDNYEKYNSTGNLLGPFKSFMEVTYNINKMTEK